MLPNPDFPSDLVTFTKEIINGQLHLLCSAYISIRTYFRSYTVSTKQKVIPNKKCILGENKQMSIK